MTDQEVEKVFREIMIGFASENPKLHNILSIIEGADCSEHKVRALRNNTVDVVCRYYGLSPVLDGPIVLEQYKEKTGSDI